MKSPSCANQLSGLIDLLTLGGREKDSLQLRMIRPRREGRRGGFATMHVKSWLLDDLVYVGGSFNPTRNADSNNEEHLIAVRDRCFVAKHRDWLDPLWSAASRVSLLELQDLMKDVQRKKESRSATRSRARDS